MKIHSIKLNIQDVLTKDNVPVVALMGAIYLDDGKKITDDEGKVKLNEDGTEMVDFTKVNFTSLLSQNVVFKKEIQKMAIEAITLYNLEQAKKAGKELEFMESYGLGIDKPKTKKRQASPRAWGAPAHKRTK